MSQVTQILSAIERGDAAAAEQLLPLVYRELRNLAAQRLATRSRGTRWTPRPWFTRRTCGSSGRVKTSAGRPALLDRECGADAELRRQVEALLRAHDAPGSFLDQPAIGGQPTEGESAPDGRTDAVSTEQAGTMIGNYKLLEQIGEGGFGVVFMAEQTEPVRRKVALKILKPGMDTRQVVARFEAERQALAIMDHPNIAKVFDGGMTGVRSQETGVRNQGPANASLTPVS